MQVFVLPKSLPPNSLLFSFSNQPTRHRRISYFAVSRQKPEPVIYINRNVASKSPLPLFQRGRGMGSFPARSRQAPTG